MYTVDKKDNKKWCDLTNVYNSDNIHHYMASGGFFIVSDTRFICSINLLDYSMAAWALVSSGLCVLFELSIYCNFDWLLWANKWLIDWLIERFTERVVEYCLPFTPCHIA